MTSKNTLIIGTPRSALALAQADMVRAALSLRYPELDVRCEIIHTIGDRRTDVPLADVARVSGMVDKGIFIKELETALRDGRIDVAVHSLKDVPSELAAGFTLAAVLPRAAVEDVLITKEPDWNGSGTLATGSVRRRLMARTYWVPACGLKTCGECAYAFGKAGGTSRLGCRDSGQGRFGTPGAVCAGNPCGRKKTLHASLAGGSFYSCCGAGHRWNGMPFLGQGDGGNAGRHQ